MKNAQLLTNSDRSVTRNISAYWEAKALASTPSDQQRRRSSSTITDLPRHSFSGRIKPAHVRRHRLRHRRHSGKYSSLKSPPMVEPLAEVESSEQTQPFAKNLGPSGNLLWKNGYAKVEAQTARSRATDGRWQLQSSIEISVLDSRRRHRLRAERRYRSRRGGASGR